VALKDEFDQLYEDALAADDGRVADDRISRQANQVRVLDRFLSYARSKPAVCFARKDEIAACALGHRAITPRLRPRPRHQRPPCIAAENSP
jgi:hypothetical protein